MAWIQAHWQYLAIAGAVLVVFAVWRAANAWEHGRSGRKKLAKRYALEAKPYKEVEKDWLDSLKRLRTGNTLVIPIIHDISFDFLPRDFQRQYLTVEEASTILAEIDSTNSSINIDIVLHTLGGDALAAEMVADAVRSHKGRTRAYVPYVAMSAGTLVALAADELYMGKTATLGPIDTQYYGMPADAWDYLIKGGNGNGGDKRPIRDDLMFMLAYLAKKRGESERQRALGLLNRKYTKDEKHAERIIDTLTAASHHGERFTVSKLREKKGLNIEVVTPVPADVCTFVDLRLRMLEMYPKHGMESMMTVMPPGSGAPPSSTAAAPKYAPILDLRTQLSLPGKRQQTNDASRHPTRDRA